MNLHTFSRWKAEKKLDWTCIESKESWKLYSWTHKGKDFQLKCIETDFFYGKIEDFFKTESKYQEWKKFSNFSKLIIF